MQSDFLDNESLLDKINGLTPMYKQYFTIQLQYPDAIILYQCGDFYEIWGKLGLGYPKKAHQILDIKLTKRNHNDLNSPDMCGIPLRVADAYFQKLVEAGETVVVVSQKINGTRAEKNKGVERFVERILSPGTIVENISSEKSNYYACLYEESIGVIGVSLADLSTGEVKVTEILEEELNDYLTNFNPAEILICGNINLDEKKYKTIHKKQKVNIKKISSCGNILSYIYEINAPTSNPEYSISVLGLDKWRFATLALSNMVDHLSETDHHSILLKKLSKPEIYNRVSHLVIPMNGLKSLEVFESQIKENHQDSLIYILDNCKTAMGRRKLREWLREPLIKIDDINHRYDLVSNYIDKEITYPELNKVYDISRLARRIFLERLYPSEMKGFYDSLISIKSIAEKENYKNIDQLDLMIKFIEGSLDISKLNLSGDNEFDFFRGEFKDSLTDQKNKWDYAKKKLYNQMDSYNDKIKVFFKYDKKIKSKSFKEIVETKETFKLKGPKSLYPITKEIPLKELSNQVEVIDSEWISLANNCYAEMQRYKFKARKLWNVFQREFTEAFGRQVFNISNFIAEIDVLVNFAQISKERDYNRPKLVEKTHAYFNFQQVRHPVIEQSTSLQEDFVPNDIGLNDKNDIICIYGANSSGKSTLLKSVALNIIMAQIGCFISSGKESELSPFYAILTRMTTYDSLSEGLSTFTMEMKELQESLNYMKEKSLFLLDEIGRGTSSEDGEALAFATLEFLSKKENNSLTFFATHYHDLKNEIEKMNNISIKHMDFYIDGNGKLIFPRVIKDGIGDGSYGIEVASSCGLPSEIIRLAKNYNKKYAPLKKSRYNKRVEGIICPFCEINPVQETHHIIDQKQGRVKEIEINGVKKKINHKDNLIMICGSCHNKITRKELILNRKRDIGKGE